MNHDRYDLTGKVAIITGATKGIGLKIAERFVASGARVALSSRTAAELEQVTGELNARNVADGPVAVGAAGRIENKADLQRLVDLALETWGSITTLVCNASGLAWLGRSADMPDAELDFQFTTVFKSKFWLVNMAAPAMIKAGGGSIIFIGSGSAQETTTERSVYAAMRAAELALMRNYAAELGPSGIRVNAISPGLIRTFSSAPLFANETVRTASASSIPLRRTGEPEELAAAAAFLASESGAFVTGTILPVDGGRLIKAGGGGLRTVYGDSHRASVGADKG